MTEENNGKFHQYPTVLKLRIVARSEEEATRIVTVLCELANRLVSNMIGDLKNEDLCTDCFEVTPTDQIKEEEINQDGLLAEVEKFLAQENPS